MANYKRKNYLINKPLQLKYAAIIMAIVTAYSAFILYSICFSMRSVLDSLPSISSEMVIAIQRQNGIILLTTAILLVVNIIFVGFIWVLAMHKIAGPIYRLQKGIEEIKDGRLPRDIQLRKGDELFELKGNFNEMVSALRSAAIQDADELGTVLEKATALLTGLKDAPSIDSAKLLELEQLTAGLGKIREKRLRAINT